MEKGKEKSCTMRWRLERNALYGLQAEYDVVLNLGLMPVKRRLSQDFSSLTAFDLDLCLWTVK